MLSYFSSPLKLLSMEYYPFANRKIILKEKALIGSKIDKGNCKLTIYKKAKVKKEKEYNIFCQ